MQARLVDVPGAERQELRHLLSQVLKSSTGEKALDFIEGLIGRRVMAVSMSSTEIKVVAKALRDRAEAA